MSIAEAFATYFATISGSIIGQDLIISNAPSSNKIADSIYWIQASGGGVIKKNQTGENLKSYSVEVRYRNRDYEAVYDNLQSLEEQINSDRCTQLSGFDTVDMEATTFPVDNDLDSEDRKVGLLQVNLVTYKE